MGKIDASAFQRNNNNNDSETESVQKQSLKVGKLNTSKLFVKENEEQDEDIPSRPISVGKLKVGTLYQQNNEAKEEEKKESFRVGKLKKDVWKSEAVEEKPEDETEVKEAAVVRVGKLKINAWSNSEANTEQSTEKAEPVKLRGARRINKGNRISCLIENLHSDKKQDDSDEEANELSDTEDEVKLGQAM